MSKKKKRKATKRTQISCCYACGCQYEDYLPYCPECGCPND